MKLQNKELAHILLTNLTNNVVIIMSGELSPETIAFISSLPILIDIFIIISIRRCKIIYNFSCHIFEGANEAVNSPRSYARNLTNKIEEFYLIMFVVVGLFINSILISNFIFGIFSLILFIYLYSTDKPILLDNIIKPLLKVNFPKLEKIPIMPILILSVFIYIFSFLLEYCISTHSS